MGSCWDRGKVITFIEWRILTETTYLVVGYLGLGQSGTIWSHQPNDNIISDHIKRVFTVPINYTVFYIAL